MKGLRGLSIEALEVLLQEAVEYQCLQKAYSPLYERSESKPYTGWVKILFLSGKPRQVWRLKEGKPHGGWTSWHENGREKFSGEFVNGRHDGTHTRWHENGQKRFEGTYKNGEPVGLHESWHENGQKKPGWTIVRRLCHAKTFSIGAPSLIVRFSRRPLLAKVSFM